MAAAVGNLIINSTDTLVLNGGIGIGGTLNISGNISGTSVPSTNGWSGQISNISYPLYGPADFSGIQLWFDANDYSTLVLGGTGGNELTQWNDKSGFSRNATLFDTGLTKNTYGATLYNGLPGIQFVYNQGFSASLPAGTLSNGATAFVVFRKNGGSVLYEALIARTVSQWPASFDIYNTTRFIGNGSNGSNGTSSLNIATATGLNILSFSISYTSPTNASYSEWVNGSSAPIVTFSSTVMGDTATAFYIGTRQDRVTSFNGVIAEIIVYNRAMNTNERQIIEGYLAGKWNMQSNLNASHPYKSVSPKYTNKQWIQVAWSPELSIFATVSNTDTTKKSMISSDGVNWILQDTPSGDTNGWHSICWSPKWRMFVSLSASGTTNKVMLGKAISGTDISWNYISPTSSLANSFNWYGLCWSSNLELFCAVSTGGKIMTSPDAITWTDRTSGIIGFTSVELRDVIWITYLTLFVAVGANTNRQILTSPDGINWTTRSTPVTSSTTLTWMSVEWSPSLSLIVAVASGDTTNQRIMTSSDGIVWTLRTSPTTNSLVRVKWSPELQMFKAVGQNGATISSINGIDDWANETSPSSIETWRGLEYSSQLRMFCATPLSGTIYTAMIFTSGYMKSVPISYVSAPKLASNNQSYFVDGYNQGYAQQLSTELTLGSSGNKIAAALNNQLIMYGTTTSQELFNDSSVISYMSISSTAQDYLGNGTNVNQLTINSFRVRGVSLNQTPGPLATIVVHTATTITETKMAYLGAVRDASNTIMARVELIALNNIIYVYQEGAKYVQDISFVLNQTNINSAYATGIAATAGSGGYGVRAFNYTIKPYSTQITAYTGRHKIDPVDLHSYLYGYKIVKQTLSLQNLSIALTPVGSTGNILSCCIGTLPKGTVIRGIFTWVDVAKANGCQFGLYSTKPYFPNDAGINWISTNIGSTPYLRGVCWGNDKFVAVAYSGGSAPRIIYSTTGTSWTVASSVGQNWYGVTYSPTLSIFCTVATGAYGTSSDGINWTIGTTTNIGSASRVVWASNFNSGNGLFITVNINSVNMGATSTDGTTWTSFVGGGSRDWRGIAYSPTLGVNGRAVAVSASGTELTRVMTSDNGTTWNSQTVPSSANINWQGVCWSDTLSMFVAVANSGTGQRVMTSSDGITWVSRNTPADNEWWSVTWGSNLFVAVGGTGTGNRIMTSPDGITWTLRTSPANNRWRDVCWSPVNYMYVAVCDTFTVANSVMSSKNSSTSRDMLVASTPSNGAMSAGFNYIDLSSSYMVSDTATHYLSILISSATNGLSINHSYYNYGLSTGSVTTLSRMSQTTVATGYTSLPSTLNGVSSTPSNHNIFIGTYGLV